MDSVGDSLDVLDLQPEPGKASGDGVSDDEASVVVHTVSEGAVKPHAELLRIMREMSEPSFDVLKLGAATQNHPLLSVAMHCIFNHNLLTDLRLEQAKLSNFLFEIESGYKSVPYHNCYHAADVVASVHRLIQQVSGCVTLEPEDKLALFTSAAIHDYKHPGRFGVNQWKNKQLTMRNNRCEQLVFDQHNSYPGNAV